MLLHDDLERAARTRPDHPALICGDRTMTYAEIDSAATRFARHLLTHGFTKGARTALYLGNVPEAVVAMYGTWRAGGCIVPFGTVAPMERFERQVRHCGADVVIARGVKARPVVSLLRASGELPQFIWVGDAPEGTPGTPFAAVMQQVGSEDVITPQSIAATDLAAIIYTSGSSGAPKGVMHTHGTFDAALDSIIEYLGNNQHDVILSVLQLNFSYGLLQLLATIRTQATFVLESGFGYSHEVVTLFKAHSVTGFAGAPTIWAMLLQLKDITASDFATVRYITNAAAAMPAAFVPRLAALFTNARIFLMHGMTEVFRTAYLPPTEVLDKPTSIGLPMRGVRLWLENEEGGLVAPGQTGELVIGGATVMKGYWNDPAATDRILRPSSHCEGLAIYSGDLFRTDEHGYFYFVARKDDVIKSRGEKVSPVEVEAAIYHLPEVAECRVIGLPDPVLGNKIRAEIVLKPDALLDERAVKAHCTRHLEVFKVPQEVHFVGSLPKTEGGKVVRARCP